MMSIISTKSSGVVIARSFFIAGPGEVGVRWFTREKPFPPETDSADGAFYYRDFRVLITHVTHKSGRRTRGTRSMAVGQLGGDFWPEENARRIILTANHIYAYRGRTTGLASDSSRYQSRLNRGVLSFWTLRCIR